MNYVCTGNKNLKSKFKNCILDPIPIPGTLWCPDNLQKLPISFFNNIDTMTAHKICLIVMENLLGESIPTDDLSKIIIESLNFDIPLKKINNILYILELFHGPTLTFKDIGARFMSNILKYYLKYEKNIHILVSTSGDTGSAVADAFQNIDNAIVHILYPKKLISSIQEKQITSYGNNIYAYEVDGNFDECQTLVKKSICDKELTDNIFFFPANSINIARLIPQCLYYFLAYAQLKKMDNNLSNICICVPSGNLGNLTGGMIAKKLGLPIHHFIGATNINNSFGHYLKEGILPDVRAVPTVSSAMDISIPNNLKRLVYIFDNDIKKMSQMISSYCINDNLTLEGIVKFKEKYNYTIDPHTSVGYQAINMHIKDQKDQKDQKDYKYILLSTAHPAKFPEIMDDINISYTLPDKIKLILNKLSKKKAIEYDYLKWKNILLTWKKKHNITLIGMPGSGKSYIGKKLAEKLRWKFIDIDVIIENNYNMKLFQIISKYGNNKFKEIEEEILVKLDENNCIYSTGGSAIYSEKGMIHLSKYSTIIYLNVELDILEERIDDIITRGIVFENGQNIKELYEERAPLYEKYKEISIDCVENSIENIIKEIEEYLDI